MRFKGQRLQDEYDELEDHNPALYKALGAIDDFSQRTFGKDIMVTCIFRSRDENMMVNGISNSPHMFWRAADLRSREFSDEQIKKLVEWINQNYKYNHNPSKPAAMCHAVPGGVYHFHIQIT